VDYVQKLMAYGLMNYLREKYIQIEKFENRAFVAAKLALIL